MTLLAPTTFDRNNTLRNLSDRIQARLNTPGRTPVELAELLRLRLDLVEAIVGVSQPTPAAERVRRVEASDRTPELGNIRSVREGRCLSLRDVVQLVNSAAASARLDPVTLHHIRSVDAGFSSDAPQILPLLDMCLRTDGRLCLEQLGSHRGQHFELRFPPYWIGPAWLEFHPEVPRDVSAEFRWGIYRRVVVVHGPTYVTFRKSEPNQPPLRVAASSPGGLRFGVGHDDRAIDLNANWLTVEPAVEGNLFEQTLTLLLSETGRTAAQFNYFWRD